MIAVQAEIAHGTTHWMVWLPMDINPAPGTRVTDGYVEYEILHVYPNIPQQDISEARVWKKVK